jgi:oligo-1,6-glucosidase
MSIPRAERPWWRSAVVYQIYPRSFADSNGDGMGDLRGIIDHLDHVVDLGIDAIWLSPIYRSPQDDNGYDISEYQDVDEMFGTLADLDELVDKAHVRGIRMMMDLVVNHTSDEHAWFEDSRSSRTAERADWYIWRDPRAGTVGGEPGSEPNNWGSFFSGTAWEWEPRRGQYYLHLFSRKQPDLNWDNPEVRDAVFAMMNWWLDRGIDGFRMDVINLISKDPALPDGIVGPNGFGDALPHVAFGPHLQDYLAEMKSRVFESREGNYLTVGETPAATPDQALKLTDRETGQLNMVFQFEHVDLDSVGDKWLARKVTALDLKRSLGKWQRALGDRGWNSLYWENHDQPRVVSRYGDDAKYWYESSTALAAVLHMLRGTPFVYQGEELGMTNMPFASIADFRDIESINHYKNAVEVLGENPEDVLKGLRLKGRDNARTPMQWTPGPQSGFTSGEPWIPVNPNHTWLNAELERERSGSVYAFYKALIRFRHEHDVVVDGDFTLIDPDHPQLYAYARQTDAERLTVYANLSSEHIDIVMDPRDLDAELILTNHPGNDARDALAPWEARVLLSSMLR